ncbi:TPA: hypothetical protein JG871_003946 [Enterobacter hormaechei subsp. xiangfangensis]|nr:hypothetical protein [Enterobacter hormaechei subsp. xiangfangensis]
MNDEQKRQKRSSHRIEDLLAQCDFSQPMSEEDREWMNAPAVGREILPPYEPDDREQ